MAAESKNLLPLCEAQVFKLGIGRTEPCGEPKNHIVHKHVGKDNCDCVEPSAICHPFQSAASVSCFASTVGEHLWETRCVNCGDVILQGDDRQRITMAIELLKYYDYVVFRHDDPRLHGAEQSFGDASTEKARHALWRRMVAAVMNVLPDSLGYEERSIRAESAANTIIEATDDRIRGLSERVDALHSAKQADNAAPEQRAVTDEMVEAAARAIFESFLKRNPGHHGCCSGQPVPASIYEDARAALEAVMTAPLGDEPSIPIESMPHE